MGVLYLARRGGSTGFSRPVAIKVIHDHLAQNKRFCRMFIDEAKLSARIDDPNVVRVDEFGQADGRYYLVMEYVHGASLAQTIGVLRRRGGIPMEHAVAIAMQIASGLHGAHEATDEDGAPLGIVHRDVSPHNVLVSYKGSVRVIDFGVAKAKLVGGQTKTGSLRGKLAYMPPEQARSARTVDRRADLYGVGLILWEMLTGRRVFDADTDIAILNQIREPQIVAPSSLAPAVPKALDVAVMRMLANEPSDRPQTGAALQRELATAMPTALRVLSGDLAGLMTKVRAAAEAAAPAGDDDAAVYGEELRKDVMTFSANMKGSVDEGSDALETRPSRPELEERPSVPPAPSSGRAPSRQPPGPLLRPADGVRRLVPSSPLSSPDALIPPPPLSSSRGLPAAPSSSSSDLMRPAYASVPAAQIARDSFASAASLGGRESVVPLPILAPVPHMPQVPVEGSPVSGGFASRPFLLGVAAALVAGAIILLSVMALGRSDTTSAPAQAPIRAVPANKAAPLPPAAPTLVAPVVIAPPEPTLEMLDAAPPPVVRRR